MEKKNLIIVGAGGSIAKEAVKYFSKDYNIIAITNGEVNKDSILIEKCQLVYEKVDIRDINNYKEVCEDIKQKIERRDAIIFACGVTIPGSIKDLEIDQWNNSIDINLRGYWLTVKFLYDLIIKSKGCSIVQINSKTGKKGSFKNSAYTASKFGGIGLTQSLALELVEYGVRVNAVCPGNVYESKTWGDPEKGLFIEYGKTQNLTPEQVREKYTSMVPMKRSCSYEDIINVIEFLLSNKSSYMTGQAINITGGQQLV